MKKFFTFIAVAAMAFAAQANVLTVCDNGGYDGYSNHVPMYGFWADTEGTVAQMIYPAAMLTDMAGGEITEVKFYTLAQYYYENGQDPYISNTNFINFENAKIQLSLMTVDQNSFEQVVVGATAVANTIPVVGDSYMTFELDEPYTYEGGNLLIEAKVIEKGTYGTTYFYGVISGTDPIVPEDCSIYSYVSAFSGTNTFLEDFLPMATFTYEPATTPVDPNEKTGAPTFNGYTTDGIHAYFVEIIPTEPSTIYYRVQYPDETWTDWAEYEDILSFTGNGKHRVEAYAVAPGKLPSEEIAYEFVVAPTGIEEMNAGKTVAGVRYFNMAGQEMSEANGLTIVVTTFTDGTTSTAKVIK